MPRKARNEITDELLFRACQLLTSGTPAPKVAELLTKEFGASFTREQIYPLLRKATGKVLFLKPPPDEELAQRFVERYKLRPQQIEIVNITGPETLLYLSQAAADLTLKLIASLKGIRDPIHLMLGSGRTTRLISRIVATKLRTEITRPRLVIHAFTGGGESDNPLDSPVAQFSYFADADHTYGGLVGVEESPNAAFVGLPVPPVVTADVFSKIRELPFVKTCFDQATESDIVITSLGAREDEHSSFNRVINLDLFKKTRYRKQLETAGWVGDVQFLPFSDKGAITEASDVRAFVVLSLDELVTLAGKKDKYVLLVAGPCGLCRKSKASALRPLLGNPALRIFTHLILDAATARELV